MGERREREGERGGGGAEEGERGGGMVEREGEGGKGRGRGSERQVVTYIVRSSVNLGQFRWVSISYAGHIQFQNVPESRPQNTAKISRIPVD